MSVTLNIYNEKDEFCFEAGSGLHFQVLHPQFVFFGLHVSASLIKSFNIDGQLTSVTGKNKMETTDMEHV